MLNKKTGCWHAVISHLRPKNVPLISQLCGNVTWYVGKGEAQIYREHGAEFVEESGGLCESRNYALYQAHRRGLPCIQISDDLRKLQIACQSGAQKLVMEAPFSDAVGLMVSRLKKEGLFLGGIAPTANLFYYNPERQIGKKNFIVGDFIAVMPCDLRFDESLKLKEDYDYTIQHLETFGGVVRSNDILAHFLHRTNKGGACATRTTELEQKSIEYLKKKWPGWIKDNPRRKDEILLAKK